MYTKTQPIKRSFTNKIYVGQVASLYADRKSVLMGLVNSGVCGIITIVEGSAPAAVAPVVLFLLIGAVRLHFIDKFEAARSNLTFDQARRWERGYTLGASSYLATLSTWTFSVLASATTPFPVAIALGATISSAFGIPIRNFAFARATHIQLVTVSAPLFACCAWLGGAYWLLAIVVLLPTFIFMKSSATRLRDLLMDELAYRQKSEEVAIQLDTAVNSMTLGLCLLSPDQRVLITNEPFRSMMRLTTTSRLRGRPLKSLLRAVRAALDRRGA